MASQFSTRRAFLATALATVGAAVIGGANRARAADGDPVLQGRYNDAGSSTTIAGVGSSGATFGEELWAVGARCDARSGTGVRGGAGASNGVGVRGEVTGDSAVAVYGDATAAGTGARGGGVRRRNADSSDARRS